MALKTPLKVAFFCTALAAAMGYCDYVDDAGKGVGPGLQETYPSLTAADTENLSIRNAMHNFVYYDLLLFSGLMSLAGKKWPESAPPPEGPSGPSVQKPPHIVPHV